MPCGEVGRGTRGKYVNYIRTPHHADSMLSGPGLSIIDGLISLCLKLMRPICEVNYMSTVSTLHPPPTWRVASI